MNPVRNAAPAILAIEDDRVLGAYVHEQLGRCGFQVTWCQNGSDGLALAQRGQFDVVLMDILLPGMNGLDVLQRLRQSTGIPVILMSALGAESDRISGFRHGADDYLPKPFSVDELQVRVQAILRRVEMERLRSQAQTPPREPGPEPGGLQFHEDRSDVAFDGELAGMTPSEFRLLDTLYRQPEEVLSKAFLYQHVLQRGYSQHDRSLDMHVSQIRRKLKAIGYTQHQLRTVWGKGYVLSVSGAQA